MRHLLVIIHTIHFPTAPDKLLNGLLAFKTHCSDSAPCQSIIGSTVLLSVMSSNFPPGRDCHWGPERKRLESHWLSYPKHVHISSSSGEPDRSWRASVSHLSELLFLYKRTQTQQHIVLWVFFFFFFIHDTWRRRPFWASVAQPWPAPSTQLVCVWDGRNIRVTGSEAVYRDSWEVERGALDGSWQTR